MLNYFLEDGFQVTNDANRRIDFFFLGFVPQVFQTTQNTPFGRLAGAGVLVRGEVLSKGFGMKQNLDHRVEEAGIAEIADS